mgnify:CR=1 FL=1
MFIRGPRTFLSKKERHIIKTTFEESGKITITRQEIRDAIENNKEFSDMFSNLLDSDYEGEKVRREKAELAIQASFRSQYRNKPLCETLYLGHPNI